MDEISIMRLSPQFGSIVLLESDARNTAKKGARAVNDARDEG